MLSFTRESEVTRYGMPIGKGQQFAGAGKGDGLEQADLAGLSHLGSDGQYPNNMFRDFKRHVHQEVHDMPRPYNAQLPMLNTDGKEVMRGHDMFLPHEIFGWLAQRPELFLRRVCGGSWSVVDNFWGAHKDDEWFVKHPAKELLGKDIRVAPVQLYGDDAQMTKGTSALVLTWSSPCCRLSSWQSRFLITVLPLLHITAQTLERVYGLVRWSFEVLLARRYPSRDPFGKVWPECWRRELGGKFLAPHGATAVLTGVLGDWKWIKESFFLKRYWKCMNICHLCRAVSSGVGPPWTNFCDDSEWRDTTFTHATFLAVCCSIYLPELCRIPGFHVDMIVPDLMHILHLGFLGFAVSSGGLVWSVT